MAEREEKTERESKLPNKRLIQQSKYNEVLRKNKAIPEVGTTQQQMRKQYDEKLSENQLQRLLSNNTFNWNLDQLMSKRFRHSRQRLLKKNKSINNQNDSGEALAKEEEDNELETAQVQTVTRSFSVQIMPCYKHQL